MTPDPQLQFEAWRACRIDALYSDPGRLADAVDEWTHGQSSSALRDLLVALTSRDRHATGADNLILQHQAAMEVIDKLIAEVVAEQEKTGEWRHD